MRNEKEELYYNITEIPHVRVTERSKNVKERKPHRYFGYCTIKIVPKHRWKRLFNFAIVLWRDGLINSLPRYAGTSGGTRPIDSSVHRHARQVTRRGRSRNCHAQAGNMCVCVHVCILSGQERASVAGCDTCFVTWISPLVYPTTSYTQLPLETVPFPHLLPPLLHRDPSMPFEYLVHRTSQPHAARPSLLPRQTFSSSPEFLPWKKPRARAASPYLSISFISRFAYLDKARSTAEE